MTTHRISARSRRADAGLAPMDSLGAAAHFVAACAVAEDAELLDYLGEPDLTAGEAGRFILRTEFGPIFVRVGFSAADVLRATDQPDGPYRPALAASFRAAARELRLADEEDLRTADELDIPEDARVEEGEGGAWVTARIFIADADRPPMAEEEDAACANCGETLQDGSGTCITCGQNFAGGEAGPPEEAEASPSAVHPPVHAHLTGLGFRLEGEDGARGYVLRSGDERVEVTHSCGSGAPVPNYWEVAVYSPESDTYSESVVSFLYDDDNPTHLELFQAVAGAVAIMAARTKPDASDHPAPAGREAPMLSLALVALGMVDFSPWPGLYDAIPWTPLEEAAAGHTGTLALHDLASGAAWDALESGEASGELYTGTGWTFADQEHAQAGGWEVERLSDGQFVIVASDHMAEVFTGPTRTDKAFQHVSGLASGESVHAEHYKPDYLELCRRAYGLCTGLRFDK